MKKMLILLAAAAALVFGQAKGDVFLPAPLAPGEVIRVVDVKQGNATAIRDNLGAIFQGVSRVGGQLIVRGQPAVVDMIEAAIKKLDVPSPESQPMLNVELTVQWLAASSQDAADSKVPGDLEATVKQLRTLFPYKSYRVLDTQVLRSRGGGLEASGNLPGGMQSNFYVTASVNAGPAPRTVRLSRLQFSAGQARLITDLDAREGQKTVVGKANIPNTEDAVFLVITPKVIE